VAGAALLSSTIPGAMPLHAQQASNCVVGVSWNNFQEERWGLRDEPAIKDELARLGATYISNDAKSSAETQASNVENLITQGANVLIILAQDGTAIKPSVASAVAQGIPVIAYDRLIEDPNALYMSFDNIEVGRNEARSILAAVPKGRYAIIKGNKADANSDFLRGGYDDVIGNAVKSGDVQIVAEQYTDNWDPKNAQTEMEQILTQTNNQIDAVLSENDGMAGGVVAALAAQGLAGKVAVSGQDGDTPALNRVALGLQTVDVWKDSRVLGRTAADAAVGLCSGMPMGQLPGVAPFVTGSGLTMPNTIFIQQQPVNVTNLNQVVDSGWVTKAELCQGVPAGSVAVCS
jgi:D-xylose transport system substrate-binding protein